MKGKTHLLFTVVLLVILSLANKIFGQAKSKTNERIELLIKEKKIGLTSKNIFLQFLAYNHRLLYLDDFDGQGV